MSYRLPMYSAFKLLIVQDSALKIIIYLPKWFEIVRDRSLRLDSYNSVGIIITKG